MFIIAQLKDTINWWINLNNIWTTAFITQGLHFSISLPKGSAFFTCSSAEIYRC